MKNSRIRFKIRRIVDDKFLFPLKYSESSLSCWDDRRGLIWNNTGRSYLSEKAAKNELERMVSKKQNLGIEIVKVKITEEFESLDVRLSFSEWLNVFKNK